MNIPQRVLKFIQTHHLIVPGDTVLLGVSGGADSVVLAHILHDLQHGLSCRIAIAHVNHQLRRGSHRDEHFVRQFSKRFHIPCHVARINLQEEGGSLEDAAREKRFQAFARIAAKVKADSLALAHHQDDLAETVLMRILRGTGLQGLQAILPQRTLKGMTVIRPLLSLSRSEIDGYLRIHHLKFRTDPSNRTNKFFRNKIRHDLVPLLKTKFQPGLTEVLTNLAVVAGEDYAYLTELARSAASKIVCPTASKTQIPLRLKPLMDLEPSLRRLVIRGAFERLHGSTNTLTLSHLLSIEDLLINRPDGSVVDLPRGFGVQKRGPRMILRKNKA